MPCSVLRLCDNYQALYQILAESVEVCRMLAENELQDDILNGEDGRSSDVSSKRDAM